MTILRKLHENISELMLSDLVHRGLNPKVAKLYLELKEHGVSCVTADDEDARPAFVGLQSVIERAITQLTQKDIKAVGAVHTPTPATPVCTEDGYTPNLIASEVQTDAERMKTVTSRPAVIREYLQHKGELWIIYPKAGVNARTNEQRSIYSSCLKTYPTLIDTPLDCDELPSNLVGATYAIGNNAVLFSIMAPQANAPENQRKWGMWLGKTEDKAIEQRFLHVSGCLARQGVLPFKLQN